MPLILTWLIFVASRFVTVVETTLTASSSPCSKRVICPWGGGVVVPMILTLSKVFNGNKTSRAVLRQIFSVALEEIWVR
ncbi:hypothetical protein ACE1B6_08315 [Aerosakkonemataceae cyanobacterium BLCC-F154]|uniref:Secreted protein n=1 Tax=Floridaenema fluviatile BLCC-F154 TaxID=3153640 RepID=A0ABV4Y8Y4_9CYAN